MFACLLVCLFLLAFSDCKLNFRLQMKDLKAEIVTFKQRAALTDLLIVEIGRRSTWEKVSNVATTVSYLVLNHGTQSLPKKTIWYWSSCCVPTSAGRVSQRWSEHWLSVQNAFEPNECRGFLRSYSRRRQKTTTKNIGQPSKMNFFNFFKPFFLYIWKGFLNVQNHHLLE